jgi:SMC interacting uncharacterized protein involved in chromosome segregation
VSQKEVFLHMMTRIRKETADVDKELEGLNRQRNSLVDEIRKQAITIRQLRRDLQVRLPPGSTLRQWP